MKNNTAIPFLDLISPHLELEEELVAVFRSALRSAAFIGGPMVQEFEEDFARFCGAGHCVGVGSGTDALRFALLAAGINKGDTVLTVPNTFIATTEAITQAGGVPDFVDIDERTYNMSHEGLAEYLEAKCYIDGESGRPVHRKTGRRIAAIVPVHLYGQPAHMDMILEIAAKYRLLVIEDACQAHGAECYCRKPQEWKKAGSMGLAAAFSFYPGKNLGACGEAGAVTTNDPRIAAKVKMLRDHGQDKKYIHEVEGYNGRLDAIQAGILSFKLAHLAEWNAGRRSCARLYDDLLVNVAEVIRPMEPSFARSVYHLYVIRVEDRDELQRYLADEKIATGLHYPVPLHLQKAYRHLGYREGAYPVAERVAKQILSLPMFPGLTEVQQVHVAEKIKESLR